MTIQKLRSLRESGHITTEEYRKLKKSLEQDHLFEALENDIKHFMYKINPCSSESDYACNYILGLLANYKRK